jgi:hypothetical protein
MWKVIFYTSATGRAPVRDLMEKDLDDVQRAKLRERLVSLQEHGPAMKDEYPAGLKQLTGHRYRCLYELRIAKDQLRVFLFFHKDRAVLVHGITKAGKGKKKVRTQYETALNRRNDWLERRSGA